MNIVMVDGFSAIPAASGGDWYRLQLLEGLASICNVTLLYTSSDKSNTGYWTSNSGFIQQNIHSVIRWSIISKKLDIIKPEVIFNKQINSVVADLVFCATSTYHVGKKIASKNNCPLVLVMHNIETSYLKNSGSPFYILMKPWEDYAITNADAVIGISIKDCEYANKLRGGNSVFNIPSAPPKRIFYPDGEKMVFDRDKLNVLFYGSLNREQNIAALDYIFLNLIPRCEASGIADRVRLIVFGSGNPPPRLVKSLREKAIFLGAVDDPARIIRGIDVVIVPVRNSAGVKVRIVETLMCGKPIIAFPESIAGLSQDIIKKINVVDDEISFIDAMNKYLSTRPFDIPDAFELVCNHDTTRLTLEEIIQKTRRKVH